VKGRSSSSSSSSSYAAIGAVIATDRIVEPFLEGTAMYSRGIIFGGHPVQCAIALKNIEIMKRLQIVETVRAKEDVFRAKLATLLELPIVGDLRGAGYFCALELVKDSASIHRTGAPMLSGGVSRMSKRSGTPLDQASAGMGSPRMLALRTSTR